MSLANGVHHLAIATRDLKTQLDYFNEVVGAELVALYWMHGVENTAHAFVKMGSTTIAFVQSPAMPAIEPTLGVSHPGFTAGDVAPGVMQHLALNVDSEEDLLAMRDRARAKGHWVMGPADHGFCKSVYLVAPEGIMLEFSTWTELDSDEWIDPEVAGKFGIGTADLARYRSPQPFASQGGRVAQPDPDAAPNLRFVFPHEWKEKGEALYHMSDEELCAVFTETTPPVPKKRKAG